MNKHAQYVNNTYPQWDSITNNTNSIPDDHWIEFIQRMERTGGIFSPGQEKVPNALEEDASDVQNTHTSRSIFGLAEREGGTIEMVQPGPRERDEEHRRALSTYSRSLYESQDPTPIFRHSPGLYGHTPEHSVNQGSPTCVYNMDLSREGSDTPTEIGGESPASIQSISTDYRSPEPSRSNQGCGSRSPDHKRCRHNPSEQGIPTDNSRIRHAFLLDTESANEFPVLIRHGENRHREDTLGLCPISIALISVPHGRPKAIHAQPARWTSLRRHGIHTIESNGVHSFIGLGDAENTQCEIWECHFARENPEDIHFQQQLREEHATLRGRAVPSIVSTDTDSDCGSTTVRHDTPPRYCGDGTGWITDRDGNPYI